MTKKIDKPRKKYVKRAPLGKIIGLVVGIHVATRGKAYRMAGSIVKNDMETAKLHLEDMQRYIEPIDVAAGTLIALGGAELSKFNSKYLGVKADLPLNIKVRA